MRGQVYSHELARRKQIAQLKQKSKKYDETDWKVRFYMFWYVFSHKYIRKRNYFVVFRSWRKMQVIVCMRVSFHEVRRLLRLLHVLLFYTQHTSTHVFVCFVCVCVCLCYSVRLAEEPRRVGGDPETEVGTID